jgi:hypothetical protein
MLIYGQLQVIEIVQRRRKRAICQCSCGKIKEYDLTHLKSGHTKSCGCLRSSLLSARRSVHRMSGTRFHVIWASVKGRTTNKNSYNYHNYGGRGIALCQEWRSFVGFKREMFESYLLHVKEHGEENTSIDRIDNLKGYSKDNCRWATRTEQANNKRGNIFLAHPDGRKMTMGQWSKELGVCVGTLWSRKFKYGFSDEECLSRPTKKGRPKKPQMV